MGPQFTFPSKSRYFQTDCTRIFPRINIKCGRSSEPFRETYYCLHENDVVASQRVSNRIGFVSEVDKDGFRGTSLCPSIIIENLNEIQIKEKLIH